MSAWVLSSLKKTFFSQGWPIAPVGYQALKGVSLCIHPGERVGLIGESGSGKSTLAKVGLGLTPATAGQITVLGKDTRTFSRFDWRKLRTQVQLLFQNPEAMLHPSMSIGALLTESARLHRPKQKPSMAAGQVLEQVGLGQRFRALPHQLSGGEQRRVGIARLLLANPLLVVADEPTAGLDACLKADLIKTLLEHLGSRCAVVLISHDVPLVLWATTRLLVMRHGQLVDQCAVANVGAPTRHAYTRTLLRSAGFGLVGPSLDALPS